MLTDRSIISAVERRSTRPLIEANVASIGQAPIDWDDPILERRYDGGRAYQQSRLELVMFTFDLAAELRDAGVTVNALHPATFMATKMVTEAGTRPMSRVADGVAATLRLVTDDRLAGVTGRHFDGLREARAHRQGLRHRCQAAAQGAERPSRWTC